MQDVDGLLLAENQSTCLRASLDLNFLGYEGFRVSKDEVQVVGLEVSYLGFLISKEQRQLTKDRKTTICLVPLPDNKRGWRTLLGMVGF